MTDFKTVVGHRIRVARADARMSQEDLAKAAAMAEALGVAVNDLCGIPKSAA